MYNVWEKVLLPSKRKFEPRRSEAEHATFRSRRLPTILTFTRGWGRKIFVSFKPPRPGTKPRTLVWKKDSGANHHPRAPDLFIYMYLVYHGDDMLEYVNHWLNNVTLHMTSGNVCLPRQHLSVWRTSHLP